MRVFKLAAGLATGYVLGSRAGREKYEQIVAQYQKVSSHPSVVQAQERTKQALTARAGGVITKLDPTAPNATPAAPVSDAPVARVSDAPDVLVSDAPVALVNDALGTLESHAPVSDAPSRRSRRQGRSSSPKPGRSGDPLA